MQSSTARRMAALVFVGLTFGWTFAWAQAAPADADDSAPDAADEQPTQADEGESGEVDEPTTQPSEDETSAEETTESSTPPTDTEPAPADDGDDSDVSDADLAALEAALAADGAESAPVADTAVAAVPSAGSGGNEVAVDIAFILDVAGAWFSDDEPMQIGAHDASVTGFNFQQLEMSIGASVDPFLRFDANLVFAPFGVEVEEAYASTLALPANFKLRAGQFLTRFGRLNPTHPHAWAFLDQPLVNGKFFGSEGTRGLGIEASWLAPLPWFVDVIVASTMADGECCARSFFGADNPGVRTPADLLYTGRIEQFFGLGHSWSLLWGLSAQFGPNSTGRGNRTEIYGSDLYLRFKPLKSAERSTISLQLEGMFRTRQTPGDVLQDAGGRAELVFGITPRWQAGARYELTTGVPGDPLDPDWTSERQRIAAQGTFFPSHFSRLRLQPSVDLPAWRQDPIYAVVLGLEVLVGAHGAHTF